MLASALETAPVFVANGRLIYGRKQWSLASSPVWYFWFLAIFYGAAHSFRRSRRFFVSFVMRLTIALLYKNPCEATPRDGSSDQSVGCQELRG